MTQKGKRKPCQPLTYSLMHVMLADPVNPISGRTR